MNELQAEPRIVATDRLRQEGRWEAFCVRRDALRAELKAGGMPRQKAADEAWRRALAEFAPLVTEADDDFGEALALLPADVEQWTGTDGVATPDLARDVLWVYDQLDNPRGTAAQAPTRGARSMLRWARQYQNRFFEQLLPKAMAAQTKHDDDVDMHHDNGLEMLDKMIADMDRQWEENALRDMPAVLKQDVESRLGEWQQWFDLDLPAEALKSLHARMAELLGKLLKAAGKSTTS